MAGVEREKPDHAGRRGQRYARNQPEIAVSAISLAASPSTDAAHASGGGVGPSR
jgi:hypothetical protein